MARKCLFIVFAMLLLLPLISVADTTGDHPPGDLVFQETGRYGVVWDTIPNWLTGSIVADMAIGGMPSGSQVVKAFLYLDGVELSRQYQGAGGMFNGNTLPWTNPASYVDDFYLSDWHFWCTGYLWDVTSYVTSNGSYPVELHGPWLCLSAFLVVVYEDQDLAQSMVSITMGEEILWGTTGAAPSTSLVSIPSIGAGTGHLILFGESLWAVGNEHLEFNGNGADTDVFWELGQAYDAGNVVTSDGTNTVELTSLIDLLLWKIVVLISPPGTGPDPIDKIEAKLDRGLPKIDIIEEKLDDGLPQINVKIDAVERKIDGLEGLNVDAVLKDIAKLEAKADRLEVKVDPVNDQLEAIEGKIDQHFGDFSFWEMEKKIDEIGGDLTGGLHHLYQVATAASIDKIEAKLDELGPDINTILWDQEIGLSGVRHSIAYVEQKLDGQEEEYWWMLKYLYATHATVVVGALSQAEEKLDGLEIKVNDILYSDIGLLAIADGVVYLEGKLDNLAQDTDAIMNDTAFGLMTIHSEVARLESKLDEMPDWDWFGSFRQEVWGDLDIVKVDVTKLEEKLDYGVQPGIETIIGMLGQATGATLAMIETKLDEMGPKIDYLSEYMGLLPYIHESVQSNTQILYGIEAKLDEDGLSGAVSYLEAKVDRFEPKIDVIYGYQSDIMGMLGGNSQALGAIEAKVDRFEPKIDNINSFQPEIYSAVTGNSQALGAIEAKLDGEGGLTYAIGYLESKLDTIEPLVYQIPYVYEGVESNGQALSAIEAKLDGQGGVQDTLYAIEGTLSDTVAGGLYQIETKLDDGQAGVRWDLAKIENKLDGELQSSLTGIHFKVDQVELKLLNELLRDNQECLAPMAYTPVAVNPHGKLEEVMWFVHRTLQDLIDMGYLIYDSRAWGEWNAGEASYNAGDWYYAGHHFWDAYKYARCDAHPPGQD